MKTVSVIIPVFNVELYLEECLNSIINQTYHYIEIILIDDGSTDKSSIICDSYSNQYSNIKVIHIKNSGVSNARNIGIEKASGDYILFVDSDDFIDKDMVLKMVSAMSEETDIVAVGYYYAYKNKKIIGMNEKSGKVNANDFRKKIFVDDSVNGFTPNKLFKAKIINSNNLKFNTNIKICEDTLFCLKYSQYINKAFIISEPLYYYRMRKSSCTNYKNEKDLSLFDSYDEMEKIDPNFYSYIENKYPYIFYKYKKELKRQKRIVRKISLSKTIISKKISIIDKLKIISFIILPNSLIKKAKIIKQQKLKYYE